MGLAGEQKQHRAVGIADDLAQPLRIMEEQRGTLVGGEAAGEADDQQVGVARIDELQHAVEVGGRALVAQVLLADAAAHQL
ncbi:hypothetical protein D3C71_2085090 [compost metagenome]